MKVKQQPDDFRVEELTAVTPGERGPFAFYRLEKRGWTTPDALAAIRRRWQIAPQRLNYGGLKDRHADTIQYLTIYHGPRRGLKHNAVTLNYLGQVEAPYSSRDILANRFRMTLRDLSPDAGRGGRASSRAKSARDGIPNYFDDQRFGSVAGGNDFVAKHMVLGQFEDALKLALTAPYEFDPPEEKRVKATLSNCWGRWAECKEKLPRSHARSLVDYLVHHPTDFRGTLARLRPELQGIYLSAYQSHLWNRIVAEVLTEIVPAEQLQPIRLAARRIARHRHNSTTDSVMRLMALSVPLPAARSAFDAECAWANAAVRRAGSRRTDLGTVENPRHEKAVLHPRGAGGDGDSAGTDCRGRAGRPPTRPGQTGSIIRPAPRQLRDDGRQTADDRADPAWQASAGE